MAPVPVVPVPTPRRPQVLVAPETSSDAAAAWEVLEPLLKDLPEILRRGAVYQASAGWEGNQFFKGTHHEPPMELVILEVNVGKTGDLTMKK